MCNCILTLITSWKHLVCKLIQYPTGFKCFVESVASVLFSAGNCITYFTNTSVQLTDTHPPPFHLNCCPHNISSCLLTLVLSALGCLSAPCVSPLVFTSSLHQRCGQPHLTSLSPRRRVSVTLLCS